MSLAQYRYPAGLLAIVLLSSGCSRPAAPVEGASNPAAPESKAAAAVSSKANPDRMKQPFKDVVLHDPPVDGEFLPELTCTGKNVAKLYESVAGKGERGGLWDQVELVDAGGQTRTYRAILNTRLGAIHIDLYPEAAPNHVRNFIALARSGYFDGLPIYKSVRESEGNVVTAYVEAGCPKGTGEIGYGSIGYWLKPEIEGNKLTHEEGAVGACHREELETASCRFYITAEKMPHMDGSFTIFGKVTRGLDIVRTINTAAVEDKISCRLKEPVPIQSATIEALKD